MSMHITGRVTLTSQPVHFSLTFQLRKNEVVIPLYSRVWASMITSSITQIVNTCMYYALLAFVFKNGNTHYQFLEISTFYFRFQIS